MKMFSVYDATDKDMMDTEDRGAEKLSLFVKSSYWTIKQMNWH